MKKFTRASLLIVLLVSAGCAQTAKVDPARVAQTKQTSERVQTVQFASKLVGKTLPYNVVLPVNYDKPELRNTRYPVLYLLHGLFGHYDNWTTHTKLPDYASQYEMIIVTPEGNDGWYTDSATVPSDKYESYLVQELIPDVGTRFRVNNNRASRAIGGLSMGGYGAMKLGIKYPEMFTVVASLSGALDAATWSESELRGFESIWRTLRPVFGAESSSIRTANDLHKFLRGLTADRIATLPFIYLDCGTEDPLFQSSRDFVDLLRSRKIPHEYRELPGGHSWIYWDAQVQEVLRLAAKKFAEPLPAVKTVAP
jgi:putative tributyrin esterase